MLHIESPIDPALALFDLSEELELRSYGEFGTPYHLRFAKNDSTSYHTWPQTLSCAANNAGAFNPTGGSVIGNAPRRNYTTYSFSREIRPLPQSLQR